MKVLQLSLQALGPFAGRETIDFTRLGESPLFLINGPTGAGKSTLLDALCFALYGQTTGKERTPAQMRCDRAQAKDLTWVELTFRVASQAFRIYRAPEQARPKQKGEGWTNQAARVELYQRADDLSETLLATKAGDVAHWIHQLLGLTLDQFRQVMVLPQGQFRELLLASSRDREAIFSQLFQTQVYKQLEEKLKARAGGIQRDMQDHQQRLLGILESCGLATEEVVGEELAVLSAQHQQVQQAQLVAEQTYREAAKAHQQAQQLAAQFAQLRQVHEQQEQHLANWPPIQQLTAKLAQDAQARQLLPQYTEWSGLQRSQKQLLEQLQACQQEARQAAEHQAWSEKALQQAEQRAAQERPGLQHEFHRLQGYQTKVKALIEQQQQVHVSQQAEHQAAQAYQQQLVQEQALREQIQQAQARQQVLAEQQQALAEIPLERERLVVQLEKRRALETRALALDKLYQKQQQALEQEQSAQQFYEQQQQQAQRLEYHWHLGQAAELAQQLYPGQPCPVCGSSQHPQPAQPAVEQGRVTKEQLKSARQAAEQAAQVLQDWTLHRQQLAYQRQENQRQQQELLAQLQEQAEVSVAKMEERLAWLEEQQVQHQALLNEQSQLQTQQETAQHQLATLREQVASIEAAWRQARDQLIKHQSYQEQLEAELPASLRSQEAVQQALVSLEEQLKRLDQDTRRALKNNQENNQRLIALRQQEKGYQEQLESLAQALQSASYAWDEALQQAGLENTEAWQSALLDEATLKRCNQQIQAWQEEKYHLEGKRVQLEEALLDQSPPDLAAFAQDEVAAEEKMQRQREAFQKVDQRYRQLEETHQRLDQAHREHQQLEAAYKVYGTLADVASGATESKISFQRFVLAVLLDEVLALATQRLEQMSRGRYALVRSHEAAGRRATGLDLQVYDVYSGRRRDVATLSGGESFMAALALALGLSEMVQAYAGGIRLETLFIDEGFGSLDTETLDLAVASLMELQTTGRMIGVISHVSELKEQLPQRIDVKVQGQVSSLQLCTL